MLIVCTSTPEALGDRNEPLLNLNSPNNVPSLGFVVSPFIPSTVKLAIVTATVDCVTAVTVSNVDKIFVYLSPTNNDSLLKIIPLWSALQGCHLYRL